MNIIERDRLIQQEETLVQSRKQAAQSWIRARSDGIAGGVSGVSIWGFVFLQSQENPFIDQVINSATAGVLGGAVVSMAVFLATFRRVGSMEERNQAAEQARMMFVRSRRTRRRY